jgi:enamine deaminase RidA (YjgF/YER057c/UK114 family)
MLKRFNPKSIAPPAGKYSHGVEVAAGARWLFAAGQVAIHPDGSIPSDPRQQHDVVWSNIKAILAEAGMGFADIVRINGYVVRPDLIPIYRAAREAALGDAPHAASTLIVVAALANPQWLVEIEVVAAKA